MTTKIKATNIWKKFNNLEVLKGIDLEVNEGEVVAVIGPSGGGKSTLLRCLNKLETIDKGSITIDGEELCRETSGGTEYVKNNDVRRIACKMGMVFQSFNLFGHLTVIENIMNPQITLLDRTRQEAYDKAMYLLNTVGLSSKALNYPDDLSGGQQQRIAIARTLAMDPDIILFDEPTSALDPGMIGEVQSVIRMLAKSGITMMIVTHEMDFARKISNRVFFMDEGGIYEEGTPKEIFERPQKPNTIKFIKRLTSLTYKIETVDYDFTEAYDELQQYAEKLLIENERISDLQIALEEIVVNNIMESTEHPQVLVRVDYSEKLDLLTLSIRYQGDHHDPKDSDNELFLEMLEEPTTELIDQIIEPAYGIYNNLIQINFKWEEAQ